MGVPRRARLPSIFPEGDTIAEMKDYERERDSEISCQELASGGHSTGAFRGHQRSRHLGVDRYDRVSNVLTDLAKINKEPGNLALDATGPGPSPESAV